MKKNILVIAGEPSGDVRAGELLKELKKLLPDISFWGIGGDHMEAQGVELIEHISRFSIIGLWEAIKNISRIHKQFKMVINNVKSRKPSLAILVDYPGFNLKLAASLYYANVPVIYYIVPQIWAWGYSRVKLIKRYVDKALVLFPFEEKLLSKAGIDCEFVGHPLVDSVNPGKDPTGNELDRDGPSTIALLPGSRKTEIRNLFPVMLDTAEILAERIGNVQFIVAENSNVDSSIYNEILAPYNNIRLTRVIDDAPGCLRKSNFAIVTSGTATLESAIMGTPLVIIYRIPHLSYLICWPFIRLPFIGLANIIAGEEVAPEFLQRNCSPEKIAAGVLEELSDRAGMQTTKKKLKRVKEMLGAPGAAARAAGAVKDFVEEKEIFTA